MDYSKFSVEDFVADDYFLRWVCENDSEAEKFWTLFIAMHPEVHHRIEQARKAVFNLKDAGNLPIPDDQVNGIWSDIASRIDAKEKPEVIPARRQGFLTFSYGIAASLMLVALFLVVRDDNTAPDNNHLSISQNFTDATDSDTGEFTEEVNNTSKTVRLHLNDGSIVVLEKNSRLRYKNSYAGEPSRHVYLTGEAFFEVSKNPKQPFFVHANEVVTKVLGTSFRVTAYAGDKNITVAVRCGKVAVSSQKKISSLAQEGLEEVNGVILLPNQQVVYQRDQELFDKTLVDIPLILSKTPDVDNFTFDNEPIANVFKVLEKAYGIEIIFDEDVIKSCFITAPLGSEPLFEKLRIICRTIGANYEIIDAKVVINSSGC